MTAIKLNVEFNEEGCGAIGMSLTGLNDKAVIPNTFMWTLTDVDKNVINSRKDVSETPASTTWVLFQGNDLKDTITSPVRIYTFSGTFDTILGGIARTNVPYTGEYQFNIRKLLNKP